MIFKVIASTLTAFYRCLLLLTLLVLYFSAFNFHNQTLLEVFSRVWLRKAHFLSGLILSMILATEFYLFVLNRRLKKNDKDDDDKEKKSVVKEYRINYWLIVEVLFISGLIVTCCLGIFLYLNDNFVFWEKTLTNRITLGVSHKLSAWLSLVAIMLRYYLKFVRRLERILIYLR